MSDMPGNVEESPHGRPPRDRVPGRGLDRQTLLDLNANAGKTVFYSGDPEVVEDVDGVPSAVPETKRQPTTMARTPVTRALLEKLGVEPHEVPNLKIIETRES